MNDTQKEIAWEECHQVAEAIGMSESAIRDDIDKLHQNGVRGKAAGVDLRRHYHPETQMSLRANVKAILDR